MKKINKLCLRNLDNENTKFGILIQEVCRALYYRFDYDPVSPQLPDFSARQCMESLKWKL